MGSSLVFEKVMLPIAMEDRMDSIITLYQESFANVPWNERSKCADTEKNPNINCPGGFSPLNLGELCLHCDQTISEEAYPADELKEKFNEQHNNEDGSIWYIEETGNLEIVLAAFARYTTAKTIGMKEFSDNNAMQEWLKIKYPDQDKPILWIQDIFANTMIRPKGNLDNFGKMILRLATSLNEIAFTTLNPKIVRAAQRDFKNACSIADPNFKQIPYRKNYVSIDLSAFFSNR